MRAKLILVTILLVVAQGSPAFGDWHTWTDGYDMEIECTGYDPIVGGVYDGMWEYWYDIYAGSKCFPDDFSLVGFDGTLIANNGPVGPQKWDWNAGHPGQRVLGGSNWGDYTTYWDSGTSQWLDATNWGYDSFNYYTKGEGAGGSPDVPQDNKYHTGDQPYNLLYSIEYGFAADDNGIYKSIGSFGGDVDLPIELQQLLFTIRIVHPNAPGEIMWRAEDNYKHQGGAPYGVYGYITGPGAGGADGDFEPDGDVDADDIDILCANMGGAVDPYDVDESGYVDEDDLIYLIEHLAEWDNGVDTGVGTKQGDFNLDGVVNATDLAIMKGTFGTGGVGYADGNANCDTVVNATDLAILKNSFGFVAATGGGVPEPVTIALLSLGSLALLRRRK